MKPRRKIIVYGDSLVLAGLRCRLQSCSDIEICDLDEASSREGGSWVVVYDMAITRADELRSFFTDSPNLLMIGIDPVSHDLLLGGQAAGNISLEQFTWIFRAQERPKRSGQQASLL